MSSKISLNLALSMYDNYMSSKHPLLASTIQDPSTTESKLCSFTLTELKEYIEFIEQNTTCPSSDLGFDLYFAAHDSHSGNKSQKLTSFLIPTIKNKGFIFVDNSSGYSVSYLEQLTTSTPANEVSSILNRWRLEPVGLEATELDNF